MALAYHFGVCPPLLSVSVFLASLPSRIAQYGSCLPIVFLFGRFLARSTTATSVPISGPSRVMSAKMPAVWATFTALDFVAILDRRKGHDQVGGRCLL